MILVDVLDIFFIQEFSLDQVSIVRAKSEDLKVVESICLSHNQHILYPDSVFARLIVSWFIGHYHPCLEFGLVETADSHWPFMHPSKVANSMPCSMKIILSLFPKVSSC